MFNIAFKDSAHAEIRKLTNEYESKRVGLGVKFSDTLDDYYDILAQNPRMAPPVDFGEFRKLYIHLSIG